MKQHPSGKPVREPRVMRPSEGVGAPETSLRVSSQRHATVTPEMLSAGLNVYEEFSDSFAPSQILEAVYIAMDAAHRVAKEKPKVKKTKRKRKIK